MGRTARRPACAQCLAPCLGASICEALQNAIEGVGVSFAYQLALHEQQDAPCGRRDDQVREAAAFAAAVGVGVIEPGVERVAVGKATIVGAVVERERIQKAFGGVLCGQAGGRAEEHARRRPGTVKGVQVARSAHGVADLFIVLCPNVAVDVRPLTRHLHRQVAGVVGDGDEFAVGRAGGGGLSRRLGRRLGGWLSGWLSRRLGGWLGGRLGRWFGGRFGGRLGRWFGRHFDSGRRRVAFLWHKGCVGDVRCAAGTASGQQQYGG